MILSYREIFLRIDVYDYKYVIIYSSEMAWVLLVL